MEEKGEGFNEKKKEKSADFSSLARFSDLATFSETKQNYIFEGIQKLKGKKKKKFYKKGRKGTKSE